MFKILRKWYFKLYHLFKLIGIFVLIFGMYNEVHAEEINIKTMETELCSSNNLLKTYGTEGTGFTGSANNLIYSYNESTGILETEKSNFTWIYSKKIIVEKNTEYKTVANNYIRIIIFDSNYNYVKTLDSEYNKSLVFTTGNDSNFYYILYSNSHTRYGTMGNQYIVKSNIEENFYEFVETECPSNNPTPQENVYSTFLTLYIEKIRYLAEGFTSNPYLIAMIGIIFTWVVLELFLHILHLRGGYHK